MQRTSETFRDDQEIAARLLAPWRRHNLRLLLVSVLSILAALPLWMIAATPDGHDAWYVGIAIEFVIWGAIDLVFAILSIRDVSRYAAIDTDDRIERIRTKCVQIDRALVFNRWLNLLWLSTGVVLLVWGYRVWSAAVVGHGTGVLFQAILLVILDAIFTRENRIAIAHTTRATS